MNFWRIWSFIPWQTAKVLGAAIGLPLLAFGVWFQWGLRPLERYYFLPYLESTMSADQPGTETEIQWLFKVAPERKSQWVGRHDLAPQSNALELSPGAIQHGWIDIEQGPEEHLDSAQLEGYLRSGFYDGQSLRQVLKEPLVNAVTLWLVLPVMLFFMRDNLVAEWRDIWRAIGTSSWGPNRRANWAENNDRFVARGGAQIDRLSDGLERWWSRSYSSVAKGLRKRVHSLRLDGTSGASNAGQLPASEQHWSGAQQTSESLFNPAVKTTSEGRPIFPGLSSSLSAQSRRKPWNESDWIE